MWRKNPPNWAQEMQRKLPGENPPNCKQFRQVTLRTTCTEWKNGLFINQKSAHALPAFLTIRFVYKMTFLFIWNMAPRMHLAKSHINWNRPAGYHTVKLYFNEKSLNISIFVLRVWKNVKVPFTMYLHHVGWEDFKTKAGPFLTSLPNISGDMKDYKKQK